MKPKFTTQAQEDLVALHAYIVADGRPEAATRLIQKLLTLCDLIGGEPGMGVRRPELDVKGMEIRSLPEGSHIIFYVTSGSEVTVVRVLHAAMDVNPTKFKDAARWDA